MRVYSVLPPSLCVYFLKSRSVGRVRQQFRYGFTKKGGREKKKISLDYRTRNMFFFRHAVFFVYWFESERWKHNSVTVHVRITLVRLQGNVDDHLYSAEIPSEYSHVYIVERYYNFRKFSSRRRTTTTTTAVTTIAIINVVDRDKCIVWLTKKILLHLGR